MECSDVMKLFIDNAKSYVQLSMGTLVFSIALVREVPNTTQSRVLRWSWTFFLISIGCGTLYQYLAVKYCQNQLLVPHIEWLFGVMLVSFYGGALLFWIMAITKIGQHEAKEGPKA